MLVHPLWTRTPLVVRATAGGVALIASITVPWRALAAANEQWLPVVPWAVPIAALYLWLWWRYAGGWGWPRTTSPSRDILRRAWPVGDDAWAGALGAGILGLTTAVLVDAVVRRLVAAPASPPEALSPAPVVSLLAFRLTSALIAGIGEETAFRGYLQGPLERRYGRVIAVALSTSAFALAHVANPLFSWTQVPFFLGVGATFGTMAALTNSIVPGLTLHAAVVALDGIGRLASRGYSWEEAGVRSAPVWTSGADASLLVSAGAAVVFGAMTVAAFSALARSRPRDAGR